LLAQDGCLALAPDLGQLHAALLEVALALVLGLLGAALLELTLLAHARGLLLTLRIAIVQPREMCSLPLPRVQVARMRLQRRCSIAPGWGARDWALLIGLAPRLALLRGARRALWTRLERAWLIGLALLRLALDGGARRTLLLGLALRLALRRSAGRAWACLGVLLARLRPLATLLLGLALLFLPPPQLSGFALALLLGLLLTQPFGLALALVLGFLLTP